jgi:signal transduction histidine kinase
MPLKARSRRRNQARERRPDDGPGAFAGRARGGLIPPKTSILLVDDDRNSLTALRELLQGLARNLVLAGSGAEALRCVLSHDFAVILLDVRMPGIDGFETARLIRQRERSRHTPIIFLSGVFADSLSMFRGYEAGAVDYIVKPVIPEVLRSKVSVFIDLYDKNTMLSREIAERKLAEGQLQESKQNLRLLAVRLESVREEERKRIAREIHDELGQALTGLKMDLTWLTSRFQEKQAPLVSKAESIFRLIDDTIQSVRRIATGLRPAILDEDGLAATIEWQARDFRMRSGIRCSVTLPPNGIDLDPERSTAAFRIFQELLTNIARHSGATRVEVRMRLDVDSLVLEVQDNGSGISEAALDNRKSLGLLGMRERALAFGGNIEITGGRGKGTLARVSIPLPLHLHQTAVNGGHHVAALQTAGF